MSELAKRAERLPAHYCDKCDRFYYERLSKDRCPSCKGRLRFLPLGADQPLPPIPDEIIFTEEDHKRASARWDRLMPEYRGLLDAKLVPPDQEPDA